MTITEWDFPCGCKTDGFDPRVWHLCPKHETAEAAIHEWAAAGALLHRAINRPALAEGGSVKSDAASVREWDEVYAIRRLVGQWLRLRAQHVQEPESIGVLPGTLGKALMHQVLTQIAADADHSDLLIRLLRGEEPLSFDEWKERRPRGI